MIERLPGARTRRLLLAVALLAVALPCAGAQAQATWTLSAHISLDGDLREPGIEYALRLAEAARAGGWSLRLQLVGWTDPASLARLSEARGENVDIAHRHTDEPARSIRRLMRWSRESAPAQRHALIVYGHDARDALDGATVASFSDIAEGISRGLARPVDLLIIDRCYGATIEAAWELRDTAEQMLAAPGRRSSRGLPWAEILQVGLSPETTSAAELAGACLFADRDAAGSSMIALSPSASAAMADALTELSEAASRQIADVAPLLSAARSAAAVPHGSPHLLDLRRLCEELARDGDGDLRGAALATISAVADMVPFSTEGDPYGPAITFRVLQTGQQEGVAEDDLAHRTGWADLVEMYRTRLHELINRPPGASGDGMASGSGCGESRELSKQVLQSWPG